MKNCDFHSSSVLHNTNSLLFTVCNTCGCVYTRDVISIVSRFIRNMFSFFCLYGLFYPLHTFSDVHLGTCTREVSLQTDMFCFHSFSERIFMFIFIQMKRKKIQPFIRNIGRKQKHRDLCGCKSYLYEYTEKIVHVCICEIHKFRFRMLERTSSVDKA